jgi:hypothetical protein
MRHPEARVHATHPRIDGQLLEVLGGIPEGHAAIALAMFVAALEGVSGVTQHRSTGRQQPTAERGAVLEAARENDGDDVAVVLLFERAILRAARTHHISDRPSVAASEDARHRLAGAAVLPAVCQRAIQIDRNFCQDPFSGSVL